MRPRPNQSCQPTPGFHLVVLLAPLARSGCARCSMKALPAIILAVVLLFCGCNSSDKAGDALRQAKVYAQRGEFEKALQEQVWFHNNALQVDRSYYGVRLS